MTAFATRAVHAGNDPAAHNGAVTTPIYQAATFVRPRAQPVQSGWDYSRIANPTRADLEECLAALEGGASAVAVASGMAACVTVLQAFGRAGGHVVIPDNVYGGTWDLVHDVYARWGLADRIRLEGEIPSAAAPPDGCVFHTRCPRRLASGVCETTAPPVLVSGDGLAIRCHIPPDELRRLQGGTL